METNAEILEKIKKLLRLAQSDNEHESALAAAKAQELMDRHQIEQAMLEADAQEEPDEDIVDFRDPDDALDSFGGKKPTWKGILSGVLARHNACGTYYYGSRLNIVGRPTDVATVRYLYAYCVREIERFVVEKGPGHGRTWYNNYRRGCVDAIGRTLDRQREVMRQDLQKEACAPGGESGRMALVKVNDALAKFDERRHETRAWIKENLKLGTARSSHSRHDSGAYKAGLADGAKINMGSGKGALGRGATKRLGGG